VLHHLIDGRGEKYQWGPSLTSPNEAEESGRQAGDFSYPSQKKKNRAFLTRRKEETPIMPLGGSPAPRDTREEGKKI